jgi:hypothetical protein
MGDSEKYVPPQCVKVLVASKSDVACGSSWESLEEILEKAQNFAILHNMSFFQCSSVTGRKIFRD